LVFDGLLLEPPDSDVQIAVERAREITAAGIVGARGRSVGDVDKVAALAMNSGHKLDQLCRFFPELVTTPRGERAEAVTHAFTDLISSADLPTSMQPLVVPMGSLPDMATHAMRRTRLLINNTYPVTPEDAFAIYKRACR